MSGHLVYYINEIAGSANIGNKNGLDYFTVK